MPWIKFFLRDLATNINDIFFVILALGEITGVGVVYFRSFVKEKRPAVLISGGMVAGTGVFILFLGVLSHIFKGRRGIWVIFSLYLLSGLLIFYRNRKKWKFNLPGISVKGVVGLVLLLLLGTGFVVKSGDAIFGGDVTAYWGLATSFANGNYPQVLPWQPQFLTVHHQGAFLFEGALHAITGVDIRQVHFLFAAFIISGGFFLLWAFIKDSSKSVFFSMIPSLLGYITMGGFFMTIPIAWRRFDFQENLLEMPTLHDAKNALGAVTSFSSMYYLIPRATAFSLMILVFLVVTGKFVGSERKRLTVLAALSGVILSVDESVFAAIILPVSFWVAFRFFSSGDKKAFLKSALVSVLVFFVLFWIVGNPLRDSLLTPSSEASRFQIVGVQKIIDQGRVNFLKDVSIYSGKTPGLVWYLPDFRIILVVVLVLSLIFGGPLAMLFALAAVGTTILYFLVDHAFWPQNYRRFLLMSYQFSGFAFGVVIYRLLQVQKNKKTLRVLGVAILLFVLPSTVASTFMVLKSLPSKQYSNFYPLTVKYKILEWIRQNLPYDAKVFFVDGFLYGRQHSDLTLQGTQGYGLFIPRASVDIKMHTPEWGIEAIDVINTLSPSGLNDLGIEYLFITFDQVSRFSKGRQLDILNPKFLEPVHKDEMGVLYKVRQAYFSEGLEEDGVLRRLPALLSDGSQIYIDLHTRLNYYLKMALLLALKDKGDLYMVLGPRHYNNFNYIETFITTRDPSMADGFDYLVLGPETDPREICPERDSFKKVWETSGASVFEVE